MTVFNQLLQLRSAKGDVITHGLKDEDVNKFIEIDPDLVTAIELASQELEKVKTDYPELIDMDEADQLAFIHADYINFYAADAVNPYVALAGKGPWIVTLKGAVLHDSGGYGMLGAGHGADHVLEAMARPHVMANIMTPSFYQKRLSDLLKKEIGQGRDACPFEKFICMNSGSEAVTVASRISDVNAKKQTGMNGEHYGKTIKIMALEGAFHGRTDRPAQYSDSSLKSYKKNLASFQGRNNLITVPVNDVEALKQAFDDAANNNEFIESLFIEPVMGEGNPGMAITPEFYATARELTEKSGTLFLVDSIQAGLRAQGCLSICDYPGFENLPAPDMETYSKALNAGHYPLSVLAMNKKAAELYVVGIYGNTMTANPKALDVAYTVLTELDEASRQNIRDKGKLFVSKLKELQNKMHGEITNVQGTGLLFSCELAPEYKAYGKNSIEEYLRYNGLGVIHGGENSLRFTPHFNITDAEVDLLIEGVENALINGPKANSLDKAS
ncbi:aminotransferase class III-fold pyridoxal phosphate-dependent enzyme [Marinicella sp. S1101]|uniref:aminotransferase class III-fold pyridoxal phosphate-dependent enzyme n=1 Tax=Marinicella marina TaxID=2996016 RepID=UPI002260E162|nr:aminotransferase class III-fold pyridoxal phosphate-dependent enzyme [Marinicella marina]MCX7554170.1 aminotransferase class III-fold pyridoxal phosphate-dependent enzyme [Marinicella marina]MDJ1141137.1 aminotransferase class III-fold pyridoxal phosphate-dependent enzyme [Marinicella marina]